MSYMEPRMIWAYIVPSGTQLYVQNVYTRSGYIVNRAPYATTLLNNTTAGGGRDWGKWLYGNIGIFPYGWTGAAWANTTNYYLTVLALDSHAGVAHYTTYYQGRIFSSGTFAWNDGTGHP